MSAITKYDVIIAGGGPAGSTAGYLLSKSGLRVLIIDKSVFPREKLCGGLITWKTVRLLERVFNESITSLKGKNIINYESGSYEVFCRNEPMLHRDIDVPFRFVERGTYDSFLLEMACSAGADFIGGDAIGIGSLDILRSTLTTKSGRKFHAGIIIGADGVNSRIRRSFLVDLFGREEWTGNLAVAHEVFVSRDEYGKDIDHPCFFYGYVDNGYAWIFPNRDRLKIGICARNSEKRKSVLTAFDTFLSSMNIHAAKEKKMFSYVLPYGSFLPSPVFRNVVLIGDAAGLADPLLGEGIFYAQRSAELASQAICAAISHNMDTKKTEEILAKTYIKLLQTHLYTEFEYAGRIRQTIFTYLKRLNYLPLKILLNTLGNKPAEAVHGIRSYRWLKRQIPD